MIAMFALWRHGRGKGGLVFLWLADITSLASGTTRTFERVGALILICVLGFKLFGFIAQDRFGAALGLLVVALIPAMFLFDPAGASSLLSSTVRAIGG